MYENIAEEYIAPSIMLTTNQNIKYTRPPIAVQQLYQSHISIPLIIAIRIVGTPQTIDHEGQTMSKTRAMQYGWLHTQFRPG